MRVLQRCLEHGVLPVRTLAQNGGIRVVGVGLAGNNPSVVDEVLIILGILAQIHHVEALHLTVDGQHAVVAELGVAGLTALGGDEHHTVGTLGTIDGGGGGVLQDFHRNDIRGVQRRQRRDGRHLTVAQTVAQTVVGTTLATALHNDTIDDVERLLVGID